MIALHQLAFALSERGHPDLAISLHHKAWRVEITGAQFSIVGRAPALADAVAHALAQYDRAVAPLRAVESLTAEFLEEIVVEPALPLTALLPPPDRKS